MDDIGLPTGFCPSCDQEVLAWATQADMDVIHACLACDTPLPELTWRDPSAVLEMGYPVEGARDPNAKRGCRGGACGVRQRE